MAFRKKLRKKGSKRLFKKGMNTNANNYRKMPERGGFRL